MAIVNTDEILMTMVENISEVKTLVHESAKARKEDKEDRKLRQGQLDNRLAKIESRVKCIENKIVKTETGISIIKRVTAGVVAIFMAVIAFDWDRVTAAWHAFKAGQ